MEDRLLDYFDGDELAATVWKSKYADDGEITPDDMHHRMALEFARIERGYIDSERNADRSGLSEYGRSRDVLTVEKIYELFAGFKYVVPQGSVMSTLGTNIVASLSNCFVVPEPLDSYGSIMRTDQELAQLYKRRGGVGTGISNLRPIGTPTTNIAKTSTGAVSFMERFSNTTREVAMNGRRGALMLTIDCRHPDLEQFIDVKRDLSKVTGANISIKIRDEFMHAVISDSDYILRWPIDRSVDDIDPNTLEYDVNYAIDQGVYRKVNAKKIWKKIIDGAWASAEPGIIYMDRVIDYSPDGAYEQYRPKNPNPCGEQFLEPYNSCRLIFTNLFGLVANPFGIDSEIDSNLAYRIFYEMMRLGDDLVDLEIEHVQRIIDKIKSDPEPDDVKQVELELWTNVKDRAVKSRRIGAGITALGDVLAALGHRYDSDGSLAAIDALMRVKMRAELDCLIDLSILRGSFDGWSADIEYPDGVPVNSFFKMLLDEFPEQVERMKKYGRRSVSWSTIAPVGSGSILTQTTSGCEPLFMPFHTRRRKINPSDTNSKIDFVDQLGDKWQEYAVLHPKFKLWMNTIGQYQKDIDLEELQRSFETSPYFGSTANEIDWVKRIEIQSILQKYTTNAISSTLNLPSDVSTESVDEIYMRAWQSGAKGCTIYRDGCRTGVLVSNKEKVTFEQRDAPKRPKRLDCDIHVVSVKGTKYNVIIGKFEGKPYEVFCHNHVGNVTKGSGSIIKDGRGKYRYVSDRFEDVYVTADMSDEQTAIARLLSASLRHGTEVKFLCEQLLKTGGDLTSFTRAIARVLKTYIEDGETSTISCESCGSQNVVFEEGCSKCLECGSSKCS